MNKWLKRILIILGIIVLFVVVVIVFISPIAKYFIEKYDVKYTGREIEMDWLVINPFSGYIHMNGLKMYEHKSDSVFFSVEGITVNFSLWKMISGTYKIESFTMDSPMAKVIRDGKRFNFTDLLEKFASKEEEIKPPKKKKEPLQYIVQDIDIRDGTFYYIEKDGPINYYIKKTSFSSRNGISWNVDTVNGEYYLEPGTGGGSIKGDFMFNLKSQAYRFAVVIKKFDLQIFEQYMRDLSEYGSFTANLDADLKGKGNINDQLNTDVVGYMAINDFHFGKNPEEDYASFDKLMVGIKNLNPKNEQYVFDSIILQKLYFKYERYDSLDNVSRMFGKGGSNIKEVREDPEKFNLILEIVDYAEVLAKNFLHSYYKINKFALVDANFHFNDYSLREKFSIAMNPFNILADSVDRNLKRVDIDMWSDIKPYGKFKVTISLDPRENDNFSVNYRMEQLPSPMFNPYLVTYTSFPLDRGSIEFYGNTRIRDGQVNSLNHFVVIDPRVSERVRKKDANWIPMPLIMAFIRERGNVIDYEIPITGSVDNPKFNISDIITDLLKNIFVKPATTPYRMEVKNVEREVEKAMRINWDIRQAELEENQEKFLEKVVDFVKDDDKVKIEVKPVIYEEKEKEAILFFLAKKKYHFSSRGGKIGPLSEKDSLKLDEMSVKDGGFLRYLDRMVKDTMIFTVQGKCRRIVDPEMVNKEYKSLQDLRKKNFMDYFGKEGVTDRVKITDIKEGVPYYGFSFFSINYEGDYPESVKKAYAKLNELNMEKPRSKFMKERKSTLQRIFNP